MKQFLTAFAFVIVAMVAMGQASAKTDNPNANQKAQVTQSGGSNSSKAGNNNTNNGVNNGSKNVAVTAEQSGDKNKVHVNNNSGAVHHNIVVGDAKDSKGGKIPRGSSSSSSSSSSATTFNSTYVSNVNYNVVDVDLDVNVDVKVNNILAGGGTKYIYYVPQYKPTPVLPTYCADVEDDMTDVTWMWMRSDVEAQDIFMSEDYFMKTEPQCALPDFVTSTVVLTDGDDTVSWTANGGGSCVINYFDINSSYAEYDAETKKLNLYKFRLHTEEDGSYIYPFASLKFRDVYYDDGEEKHVGGFILQELWSGRRLMLPKVK